MIVLIVHHACTTNIPYNLVNSSFAENTTLSYKNAIEMRYRKSGNFRC